ncbi:MAG TPA: VWA domain-containing protein [Terriglobales bacterium]|nr:VWA domain-containing protein [Terriglobales bacterium]
MWKRALTLFIMSAMVCTALDGQAPSNEQIPTIRTTTREVILDVIVRDKHHHAVSDLRPGEIQVFEDGVPQKVNAFRDVQGAEQLRTEQALAKDASPTSSPNTPKAPATALRELNFVSIVFAQIAPLNLEFAREAVLQFLKSGKLPNTYVTVYRLDRSLQLVQPYTADNATLLKAVNTAAKGLNTVGGTGAGNAIGAAVDTQLQTNAAVLLSSPLASPQQGMDIQNKVLDPAPQIVMDPLWARNAAAQDASVAVGNALVTQSKLASGLNVAESLSNGMDTFTALRELVRSQAKLPGRKVVLYLADGLTLPMDRREVVSSMIGYANQTEVAFYAVDTRGLSVENPMLQSLAHQGQAAAASGANRVSPLLGHHEDDDIQLSVSSNKQLALEELADSTGGFAVTNTNEIALPMQRVMEDIRTHYEVAYTPSATNYDGHFRKIEVRVSRPHVTVQTRSGYFALPNLNGEPLQPFEVNALRAINTRPAPVEFPSATALLRFRPKADVVEYEAAFDVPISGLRVVTNPKTGAGRIRVSVVALIHSSEGQVVGKVSQDLVRDVSKEEIANIANDRILYSEAVELPGGHYLVDTAVTDELAGKTSVKRISVFVDAGKKFGMSSLGLVRTIQPLRGPRDGHDPFQTDTGRVVPVLADSLPAGQPIGIYFVVYPQTDSEAKPTLTLHVSRDGREVSAKNLEPPELQSDGSMPVLLQLTPDPGVCDIVITAQQGTMKSQAMLSVQITADSNSHSN